MHLHTGKSSRGWRHHAHQKSRQYGYGSEGHVQQYIQGMSPGVKEALFLKELCKATKGLPLQPHPEAK
eukprot:2391173-Ditylum_brightwellii.AAC.1